MSLPEPDRGGFLSTLKQAATGLFENIKRTIQTPFGQETRQPTPTPLPNPTPTPAPRVVPGGTDVAMNFIRSKVPNGMTEQQAFPVLGDQQFMQGVGEADKQRQGLANLLLLQAFFESTMGRNSSNIFGVKPNNQSGKFNTPSEALQYQLSPSVLGGGANPAMNILGTNKPLTLEDILSLYEAYNPEGAYLEQMTGILGGGR